MLVFPPFRALFTTRSRYPGMFPPLSLFLLHSHQVETKNSEEVDGMLRIKSVALYLFPPLSVFSSFVVFGDSTRFLSLGIPRGASVSPLYMCLFIHPSHPIQLHPISFPPFLHSYLPPLYIFFYLAVCNTSWVVCSTHVRGGARACT